MTKSGGLAGRIHLFGGIYVDSRNIHSEYHLLVSEAIMISSQGIHIRPAGYTNYNCVKNKQQHELYRQDWIKTQCVFYACAKSEHQP